MKKFMVTYGSISEYYETKEEAIAEAINDGRLGIRRPNELMKYNEKTDKFEVIGTFNRK